MRSLAATLVLTAFLAAVPATHAAGTECKAWTQKTIKGGLGSLENLEFDDAGGLLLSATGPGAIERLTPDGTVTTLVPDVNAPGGQRLVGRKLYFNTGDAAASGLMGTADGTLDSFDLDTHQRTTVASGLTMPNGLAILPNGDFVVSRDIGSGTGITRIPHEDPAHPQTNWAQVDDQNGMAVDPTGTYLYAVQTFTSDSAVLRIRIADPSDIKTVATLADPGPKGLDDMTIDAKGILYVASNLSGEAIRVDPASGEHCVIASGMQNTSSLKFGRGPGWRSDSLYVTGFDGVVRELSPPAITTGPGTGKKPKLTLTVRPARTTVGKRTRFSFKTSVGGVRIRLGGKSARTGRRGRARLTITFRRAGRKTASATKSGYRSAHKTVRVRPR